MFDSIERRILLKTVGLCRVAKTLANGEPVRSANQAAGGRGTNGCKQTHARASSNISLHSIGTVPHGN